MRTLLRSILCATVMGCVCLTPAATTWAAGVKPAPTHADVAYGPHPHQLLDIHVPPQGTGPFPVLLWFGGIWQPSKHVPDLNHFFPAQCAAVGVELRTLTDGMNEKASPPVSYVMTDACRSTPKLGV